MNAQGVAKQGNLRLVRIERTPEELLDLEIAEAFAGLTVNTQRPRAFYAIAEGERFPGRVWARRVCEALDSKVDEAAIAHAIIGPLGRYIRRKYGSKHEAVQRYGPAA